MPCNFARRRNARRNMALFEIGAVVLFVLYGLIQIGMIIATRTAKEKVLQWKTSLQSSPRSIRAKSALIIFF